MRHMAEALDKEMYNYFTQLNEAEKKSVIKMLKTFLGSRKGKVERVSIDKYNQELQEADEECERGEFLSHEEFVKQLKKW